MRAYYDELGQAKVCDLDFYLTGLFDVFNLENI